MKKGLLKKMTALLLAAASVFSLSACRNGETQESPTGSPSGAPAESQEVNVPDRGTPDRSDLMYLSAIEGYKKSDWTADWIWTKGCSEDSYVVFRKTFTLDQAGSATAYISAVEKYVLWVNGEMVVLDG